ncbi:MAG: phosphonate metabolism protein/1,5-bisphosphokinase (PRPP-forming) PhnN, partial [Mesorhizobium sp.]|nr:phosphonate metabolism protein/1,5-bisphosphokinase (PRPP-forming) PhnN [Mesorhizobium sp.]
MSAAGAPASSPERLGPGVFVAVMGPSGSGKDTLIAYARERLDPQMVVFARRVITRPCDGATEDHDTLSEAEFAAADAAGAFALSWPAHGLSYGLPASVDDAVAGGRAVVANVSRGVLPALRGRYGRVVAVHVTAAPEILAAR